MRLKLPVVEMIVREVVLVYLLKITLTIRYVTILVHLCPTFLNLFWTRNEIVGIIYRPNMEHHTDIDIFESTLCEIMHIIAMYYNRGHNHRFAQIWNYLRLFSFNNINLFKTNHDHLDFIDVLESICPDESYNNVLPIYLNIFDKCFPQRDIKHKSKLLNKKGNHGTHQAC